MAFQVVTGTDGAAVSRSPVNAEEFPVFCIPDIIGDSVSLLHLAAQLVKARGKKSETYVWNDPKPTKYGNCLDSYAEKIKDEIIKLLPAGPCYITGYSFGGSLAALVAQRLAEAGREAALFVIDTPSIEASQEYLRTVNNLSATRDLLEISNYVKIVSCYYARVKPNKIILPLLSENELNELSQKNIEEQIDWLHERILSPVHQHEELRNHLKNYAAVVCQNLLSLIQYKTKAQIQPLKKVCLVLSDESKRKYAFDVAKSWDTYSQEQEIEVLELPGSTHLSLVKNERTSQEIAKKMATYFQSYFSPEEISIMLIKHLKNNHPNVNLTFLLQMIENAGPRKMKEKVKHSGVTVRDIKHLLNNHSQSDINLFIHQADLHYPCPTERDEEHKLPNDDSLSKKSAEEIFPSSTLKDMGLFKLSKPKRSDSFVSITAVNNESAKQSPSFKSVNS